MAKTLWVNSNDGATLTIAQRATVYLACANCGSSPETTEAFTQIKQHAAGTLAGLWIYVTAATTSDDSFLRLRKNTANGNMVVTMTVGTTGIFEDVTNSDSVADNDLIDYQIVVAADDPGITMSFSQILVTFAASTNTVTRYAAVNFPDLSDGQTFFVPMSCTYPSNAGWTTEVWARFDTNAAATYKNFFAYVSSNLGVSATVLNLRQNGANTTVTISCTALTTGVFEDAFATTGHSVAGVANDDFNYSVVSNLSTFTLEVMSIEATSTDSTSHLLNSLTTSLGSFGGGSGTHYWPVSGGASYNGTEAGTKAKMKMAATTSHMTLYVVTNTIT